jgi:DNA-binding Xre family transcriptional regulator
LLAGGRVEKKRQGEEQKTEHLGAKNVCHHLTVECRLDWDEEGATMPRENCVAKQQRIGERLTRAMAKAHMDRRELAALTGYSEAQIARWECGRAPLYPTELIRLCHALDVMPEWLLSWERRLH